MKKNQISILIVGLVFVALVISNLYFFKETLDLNEQVSRIYELEALISDMEIEHQNEIDELNKAHQNEIDKLTNEYTEKFETVKKALNAFEYELEEFYKNKHILEKDYLENIQKLKEVREQLEDGN